MLAGLLPVLVQDLVVVKKVALLVEEGHVELVQVCFYIFLELGFYFSLLQFFLTLPGC